MSYGQPCRRITTGPSDGPASTYPTFSAPASICFRGAKELPPPFAGVRGVPGSRDSPCVEPITPNCDAATALSTLTMKLLRSIALSEFIRLSPRGKEDLADVLSRMFAGAVKCGGA